MSFGWSVSDIALLVRLAYKTTQGARAACGEYDELTRETYGLHAILQRLRDEADKPHSFINRPGETYKQELESISSGCQHVLTQLDKILDKYNELSDQEKSVRKLWKQVRFGSGVVADVADLRSKITSYTASLSLFINLVSMNTVGEVEKQMNRAGGDLREIKIAVNGITARLSPSAGRGGSVFTSYTNDDKDAWRELRRGLVRQGFRDGLVRRHMRTIMAYVKELGSRGVLDGVEAVASMESSSIRDKTVSGRQPTTEFSGPITVQETRHISSHSDRTESVVYTNDPPQGEERVCSHAHSIHADEAEGPRNLHRQPCVESDTEDEVIFHSPLETPPINLPYPEPGYEIQGAAGPESDARPEIFIDRYKSDDEDEMPILDFFRLRQDIIQNGSKSVQGNTNHQSRNNLPSNTAIGSRTKGYFIVTIEDNATPEFRKLAGPLTILVKCVACLSKVPLDRCAYLACQHHMCPSCLRRIFTLSITFPQLMPPKCCTADHIPLRHVDRLFDLKFKKTWNSKYREYTTKPEDLILCPARGCDAWIIHRPQDQSLHGKQMSVVCKACKTKVCCHCKGPWHAPGEGGCKPVTPAE